MSGYHLSHPKILIFIATALFISLASFLLSPNPNPNPQIPPFSCLPYVHHIHWLRPQSPALPISWQWDPASPASVSCGFHKLSRSNASDLLNGSSVLIAGDSQARLLTLALLRLLLDPNAVAAVEADLFRRHSDYHAEISDRGITVDFVWAPFESNLTALLQKLRGGVVNPDVIVLGSGLWHMLHLTNSIMYSEALVGLKREAIGLLSRGLVRSPHLFWLGLPALVSSMLNTEEKRERMNSTVWGEYDREVRERLIVRRSGGGPFMLLDMGHLSRGCMLECTVDGMHYDGVVYEAALHIMLNTLMIESQKLLLV